VNSVKSGIVAIVCGIIITVITGWIPGVLLYTMAGGLRYLMEPLLGASNYGLPLVWRSVIVYPGSPVNYHITGLVVDVVFWAVVVWLILLIALKLQKKK
jgi:hypothetical protein